MKFAWRGEISAPPIAVPLEPALLDQPPRARLAVRVLEDAAERALVRRLRRLALREQLGCVRLDRLGRLAARAGSAPRATTSPGARLEWR